MIIITLIYRISRALRLCHALLSCLKTTKSRDASPDEPALSLRSWQLSGTSRGCSELLYDR